MEEHRKLFFLPFGYLLVSCFLIHKFLSGQDTLPITQKSPTVSSWDNNTCFCLSYSKGCSGHSLLPFLSKAAANSCGYKTNYTIYIHIYVCLYQMEKKITEESFSALKHIYFQNYVCFLYKFKK